MEPFCKCKEFECMRLDIFIIHIFSHETNVVNRSTTYWVESSHLIRLHQIINIAAESRIKIGASRQLTAGRFLHPIYTYDPPHALPHNILVHQKLLSKFYGTLSREFSRNLVVGKFKKTSQTSNMKLNSCKSCNEIHFRLAQSIVE